MSNLFLYRNRYNHNMPIHHVHSLSLAPYLLKFLLPTRLYIAQNSARLLSEMEYYIDQTWRSLHDLHYKKVKDLSHIL